ncbi:MAG: GNAT family N-acetyltransferase [Burkholderiales bacterium]|nr:GNAT family N-acetyltransferase [Burkholderiales bacterium]
MSFASCKRAMGVELPVRLLGVNDAVAYKTLRDDMLAHYPDAFTSDAQAELRKPASTYLSRFALPDGDPARFSFGAWLVSRQATNAGCSLALEAHCGVAPPRDQLVGAISCERDERIKVRHVGHIAGMMVRPEMQGQGIGRALLHACIAQARVLREIEMLTLSVTSTNAPAIALYEAAGFVRYGRLLRAIKLGNDYFDKDQMMLTLQ